MFHLPKTNERKHVKLTWYLEVVYCSPTSLGDGPNHVKSVLKIIVSSTYLFNLSLEPGKKKEKSLSSHCSFMSLKQLHKTANNSYPHSDSLNTDKNVCLIFKWLHLIFPQQWSKLKGNKTCNINWKNMYFCNFISY